MGLIILLIPIGIIICIFLIAHAFSSIVVHKVRKDIGVSNYLHNNQKEKLTQEQKSSIYNTVEIPIKPKEIEEFKERSDHIVIQ